MTSIDQLKSNFVIDAIDSKIWNWDDLVKFLIDRQHQHVRLEVQEGLCLNTAGVYKLLDMFKFKSVSISTLNMLETHHTYKVQIHPYCFRYFTLPDQIDYSFYHTWNLNQVFGAIYARPTWGRMGLAAHLHDRHQEKTLLNFRTSTLNSTDRKTFELEKLFEVDAVSAQKFLNFHKCLPILIDNNNTYTLGGTAKSHTDQVASWYCNFLIDIVAETFCQGRSFYPTEKTTRPMLMKKPFIAHGPKCFLIHLRQMGFRTFNDFWDETYDGHDPEHRYHKILQLIDHLATLDMDQLQIMYEKMQPILEHNYNLLVTQDYKRQVTYVD